MHSIVIGVDETGVGACAGPLVVAAAAFNHVAGQGPRAAGKTDQRHTPVQRLADLRYRICHVF